MDDVSRWNVMIVDDEADNLGVVELVFQFHNTQVRKATSGEQCLQIMEQEAPSLLLVDIQMPVMDGYQLLEKVRQNPAWQSIPVVAVTAYARPEDQERIMAAGFDGYIAKPVNVMSLVPDLEQILSRRGDRS
jgi:CheY-like chemotaxis protein